MVATLPAVRLVDAAGNGVAGATVTFAVQSGGGTAAGVSQTTNASGIASVTSWTLGTSAGLNTLSASSGGLSPVTFTATGAAGAVASLVVVPATVQIPFGSTQQITATAADQYGNAIASPAVSYSSSAPAVATVSSTGAITGVALGSAVVTVTSATLSKTVAVVVRETHPAGTSTTTLASITGRPFGIRLSAGNLLAVTQQDLNTVTLLNPATSARASVSVGADPGDVVFNRAGTTAFVSGFNDGSVKAVSTASNAVSGTVKVSTNAYRLALSPDDTRLYVSSTVGNLFVVDPSTFSVLIAAPLSGSLQGLALSSNGQTLYVASTNGRVFRLAAATLATDTAGTVGGLPQDIAVTRDGSQLFVANEAGWVDVLDGTTLVPLRRINMQQGGAFGLALSPDEAQIYATLPGGSLKVIDRATGTVVNAIFLGGVPRRVTFSVDGSTAYVANEGGWVDVIK